MTSTSLEAWARSAAPAVDVWSVRHVVEKSEQLSVRLAILHDQALEQVQTDSGETV